MKKLNSIVSLSIIAAFLGTMPLQAGGKGAICTTHKHQKMAHATDKGERHYTWCR